MYQKKKKENFKVTFPNIPQQPPVTLSNKKVSDVYSQLLGNMYENYFCCHIYSWLNEKIIHLTRSKTSEIFFLISQTVWGKHAAVNNHALFYSYLNELS